MMMKCFKVPDGVMVDLLSLEAEGVLSNRRIESFLRVFKQFAHIYPGGNYMNS